ncbi:uncharacterized protein [Hyperolius riggenbachi]|uniref:uncharacterized protein n=1 Tax=Hyperolius riggenbachi TaxID=752182 RepID=UPI0035A31EC4
MASQHDSEVEEADEGGGGHTSKGKPTREGQQVGQHGQHEVPGGLLKDTQGVQAAGSHGGPFEAHQSKQKALPVAHQSENVANTPEMMTAQHGIKRNEAKQAQSVARNHNRTHATKTTNDSDGVPFLADQGNKAMPAARESTKAANTVETMPTHHGLKKNNEQEPKQALSVARTHNRTHMSRDATETTNDNTPGTLRTTTALNTQTLGHRSNATGRVSKQATKATNESCKVRRTESKPSCPKVTVPQTVNHSVSKSVTKCTNVTAHSRKSKMPKTNKKTHHTNTAVAKTTADNVTVSTKTTNVCSNSRSTKDPCKRRSTEQKSPAKRQKLSFADAIAQPVTEHRKKGATDAAHDDNPKKEKKYAKVEPKKKKLNTRHKCSPMTKGEVRILVRHFDSRDYDCVLGTYRHPNIRKNKILDKVVEELREKLGKVRERSALIKKWYDLKHKQRRCLSRVREELKTCKYKRFLVTLDPTNTAFHLSIPVSVLAILCLLIFSPSVGQVTTKTTRSCLPTQSPPPREKETHTEPVAVPLPELQKIVSQGGNSTTSAVEAHVPTAPPLLTTNDTFHNVEDQPAAIEELKDITVQVDNDSDQDSTASSSDFLERKKKILKRLRRVEEDMVEINHKLQKLQHIGNMALKVQEEVSSLRAAVLQL